MEVFLLGGVYDEPINEIWGGGFAHQPVLYSKFQRKDQDVLFFPAIMEVDNGLKTTPIF